MRLNHYLILSSLLISLLTIQSYLALQLHSTQKPNRKPKSNGKLHKKLNYDSPSFGLQGVCKTGQAQSPINIRTSDVIKSKRPLKFVRFNYPILKNMKFRFEKNYAFNVVGKYPEACTLVEAGGVHYRFKLKNVHFHLPAEHPIDNRRTHLEFHLVHEKDKNCPFVKDINKKANVKIDTLRDDLLVIAVRFRVDNEKPADPVISQMDFRNNGKKFDLNLKEWVNPDKKFYYYRGSLTTPNCDENVTWVVVKEPLNLTLNQYTPIKKWVNKEYPFGNARRVQALNGRRVFEN